MKPIILTILAFLSPLSVQMVNQADVEQKSPVEDIQVAKEVLVTAYSEIDSCHYDECRMSSGKIAYVGAIACPRDMKLGTEVLINEKSYICEDRYNSDLSYRFDIFTGYGEEAHQKALEFGRQELSVIIKG